MLEVGQWENTKETLFLPCSLFLCIFIVISSKPESKIRLIKSEQTSRIRELALEEHFDSLLWILSVSQLNFIPSHPER